MNYHRKVKNEVRTNDFISPEIGKKPAKVFIDLPAPGCIDLKELLKNKVINRNTFVIAVEGKSQDETEKQHQKNLRKIEKFLKANFKKYYLWGKSFHTLKLDEVLGKKKVDFAYFDFCGSLSPELFAWFYQYRNCFTKDCSFSWLSK